MNRKFSLRKCFALLLVSVATFAPIAQASAQSIQEVIEQNTKSSFAEQVLRLDELRLAETEVELLELARLYSRGIITSVTNPLRKRDPQAALDIYLGLVGSDDNKIAREANRTARRLMAEIDREFYTNAISELQVLFAGLSNDQAVESEEGLLSQGSKQGRSSADYYSQQFKEGSTIAGFKVLELYQPSQVKEIKKLSSQLAYLSLLEASGSAERAVRYAELIFASPNFSNRFDIYRKLIISAVKKGSGSALASWLSNEEFLETKYGKAGTREILLQAMVFGQERAAELIATDLITTDSYGFTNEESLFALKLLEDIQSKKINYIYARLYFEGIYLQRDVDKAYGYLEQMIQGVGNNERSLALAASRLAQFDLPLELVEKYALPVIIKLLEFDNTSALNRLGRIMITLEANGREQVLRELPIKASVVVSRLEQNFQNNQNLTSGLVAADILREGRLVESQPERALEIYKRLLELSGDDLAFNLQVRERYAKLIRQDVDTLEENIDFSKSLEFLISNGNNWAKYEYASIAIDQLNVAQDEENEAVELMFGTLDDQYLKSARFLARYAIEKGDLKIQQRLVSKLKEWRGLAFSDKDQITLAKTYMDLGEYQEVVSFIESNEFSKSNGGQVLLTFSKYKLGLIEELEATENLSKLIGGYPIELVDYSSDIKKFISVAKLRWTYVSPIFNRVMATLRSQDVDYLDLAHQMIETQEFRSEIALADMLYIIETEIAGGKAGLMEDFLTSERFVTLGDDEKFQVVEVLESKVSSIPLNGNLRLFLANAYKGNTFVKEDLQKSEQYNTQAATLGNTEALNAIALDIYFGLGQDQDKKKAQLLYEKLALAGSNRARKEYARSLSKQPVGPLLNSLAHSYFYELATSGSPTGMVDLGRSYLAGAGTEIDVQEGLRWLTKAAELGDVEALTELYYYHYIQDTSPNNVVAEEYLDKLVNVASSEMLIRKAVLLYNKDQPEAQKQAFALLDNAEKAGSEFARRLKNIYTNIGRGKE